MKKIIVLLLIVLMIFPAVSADLINPSYPAIEINNKITNMGDYPDYVFVSAIDLDGNFGPGYGMCPVKLIQENGLVSSSYYKFCSISVYAIEKTKIDLSKFDNFGELKLELDGEDYKEYFESLNPTKVIENLPHYETRHISNPNRVENNFYEVDLEEIRVKPTSTDTERNYLIYLYIGIPLIALIIMALILIKRKSKKK